MSFVRASHRRAYFERSSIEHRRRLSSTVDPHSSQFCDKLADFLDELLALPGDPVICGDFNCLGKLPVTVDHLLLDILESRMLIQHVDVATYNIGNILDLLIANGVSQLVSNVAA